MLPSVWTRSPAALCLPNYLFESLNVFARVTCFKSRRTLLSTAFGHEYRNAVCVPPFHSLSLLRLFSVSTCLFYLFSIPTFFCFVQCFHIYQFTSFSVPTYVPLVCSVLPHAFCLVCLGFPRPFIVPTCIQRSGRVLSRPHKTGASHQVKARMHRAGWTLTYFLSCLNGNSKRVVWAEPSFSRETFSGLLTYNYRVCGGH